MRERKKEREREKEGKDGRVAINLLRFSTRILHARSRTSERTETRSALGAKGAGASMTIIISHHPGEARHLPPTPVLIPFHLTLTNRILIRTPPLRSLRALPPATTPSPAVWVTRASLPAIRADQKALVVVPRRTAFTSPRSPRPPRSPATSHRRPQPSARLRSATAPSQARRAPHPRAYGVRDGA